MTTPTLYNELARRIASGQLEAEARFDLGLPPPTPKPEEPLEPATSVDALGQQSILAARDAERRAPAIRAFLIEHAGMSEADVEMLTPAELVAFAQKADNPPDPAAERAANIAAMNRKVEPWTGEAWKGEPRPTKAYAALEWDDAR
jgi:hypothetical protein